MPSLDSSAKAAVESDFAPAYYIYLDILGDPLRVTTFGSDTTFTGTGDSDLDGNTFVAFGGKLLDVSEISNSDSGSDSLTITLSGIIEMDATLLTEIGDRSKWQGRLCRVWCRIYDANGVTPQGAVFPLYTGYMSSAPFKPAPEQQSIELKVENYLAYSTQASNRGYLNQKDYDPADTSAAATIAAVNGLRRGSGADLNPGGAGRVSVPGMGPPLIGLRAS